MRIETIETAAVAIVVSVMILFVHEIIGQWLYGAFIAYMMFTERKIVRRIARKYGGKLVAVIVR